MGFNITVFIFLSDVRQWFGFHDFNAAGLIKCPNSLCISGLIASVLISSASTNSVRHVQGSRKIGRSCAQRQPEGRE